MDGTTSAPFIEACCQLQANVKPKFIIFVIYNEILGRSREST